MINLLHIGFMFIGIFVYIWIAYEVYEIIQDIKEAWNERKNR